MDTAEQAKQNFLLRYTGGTRRLYEYDLDIWFWWCAERGLDVIDARRSHLEAFSLYLQSERHNSPRSASRRLQTLRTFYKLAVADDLIAKDPTYLMRMPKWHVDPASIARLTTFQVGRLLRAAEEMSPAHHVLIALMAMLGFRVSEACNVNVEDFEEDRMGYTVLTATRKGGKVTRSPVPVPLMRIVDRARTGRTSGPLILTRYGNRQNRRGAYDWFKRALKRAGLSENAHPHTLRHAAITALVDSGIPMHEAQEFAGHSDIRTTAHYYRRPLTMDQHGAHVTTRLFASVA